MYHLLTGLHEYLTRYDKLTLFFTFTHRNVDTLPHRKDEFSVIIIGLDGAGKTVRTCVHSHSNITDIATRISNPSGLLTQTLLEKIKTIYNDTPGLPPDKIVPTVGQNSTHHPPTSPAHYFLQVVILSLPPSPYSGEDSSALSRAPILGPRRPARDPVHLA